MFHSQKKSKWCCIGFEAGYNSAGQRGHAYLIGRDSLGKPEFLNQFRAVKRGDESGINANVLCALVTDTRINYCPTCGADLMEWYGRSADELYREGFEIGVLKGSDNNFTLESPFPNSVQ